jgi:hypothetical protein
MLAHLCALFAVAVGGAFALMPLPYADASDTRRAAPQVAAIKLPRGDAMGPLLSPAPLSSERFLSYYASVLTRCGVGDRWEGGGRTAWVGTPWGAHG